MKEQENINNSDYIVIPNPIYDVVFKYLMEDNESAKIVLSTLINTKIKKLTFEPVSHAEKIKDEETEKIIRLFHLDFTAVIEKPNGEEELIMIELQKANRAGDIFRFKRYICSNFQKEIEKEIINPKTKAIQKIKVPIRLVPIFILNFRVENEVNDLIIHTRRIKTGLFTGKQLQKESEFIDHLGFDSWVFQLPNLKKVKLENYKDDEYRTKLYYLLKLFDQKSRKKTDKHRLVVLRKLFPDFLERVIRRLKAADADNPDLEEQMHVEDEYLEELNQKNNEIAFFRTQYQLSAKKLEEKDKVLKEKNKVLKEKDKALNENKKKLESNNEIILQYAKTLKDLGKTSTEIMELTKLSENEINNL